MDNYRSCFQFKTEEDRRDLMTRLPSLNTFVNHQLEFKTQPKPKLSKADQHVNSYVSKLVSYIDEKEDKRKHIQSQHMGSMRSSFANYASPT